MGAACHVELAVCIVSCMEYEIETCQHMIMDREKIIMDMFDGIH
jgi:hypothetical protein